MHLYELSEAYKGLQTIINDEENFNIEEINNELEQVQIEFDDKVESIAKMMLELEANEKIITIELDRLEARKKVVKGKYDWLKNYLTIEMETAKIENVKRPLATACLKANPIPTVNIIDESKVSHDLCTYKPEQYIPSKTKALAYFKKNQGVVPDGFEIITGKKYVVVK